jgi:hypothetical protein
MGIITCFSVTVEKPGGAAEEHESGSRGARKPRSRERERIRSLLITLRTARAWWALRDSNP